MRKLVCLLLPLVLVSSSVLPCFAQVTPGAPAPSTAPGAAACTEQGRDAGRQVPTGGAFTIGFVSGIGLGLIGTGLAWAFQGEPRPPAAAVQSLESAECRLTYADAYGKQGRSRKRGAVLTGGLLGTAVIVGIAMAAASASD